MFKQLKTSFIQTTLGSTIWITFLATLLFYDKTVPFTFIWHIIGIGLLFGLTFGVAYPYFWKYSTLKASTNIFLTTIINSVCGLLSVFIFSSEMFALVKPYIGLIVLLTLILHIIAFYFYTKYDNRKQAKQLNQLLA